MTVNNVPRLDVQSNIFTDDLPQLDFVLPGLLSGSVGVIVSAGGVGKSFVTLETMLSIAAGQDLFKIWNVDPAPGRVVYLNLEDPAIAIRHRLRSLGRHLEDRWEWAGGQNPHERDWSAIEERLDIYPAVGRGFSIARLNERGLPEVSETWRSFIQQMRDLSPRLVAVDTMNRAVPGLDENSSGHMSLVLGALEELAQEVGCAVIVLHHANKASMVTGTGAEQQAIRGSSALSDNARWQCNLMRMTAQDGEKRGLSDRERRQYVKLDAPKMSYDADPGARWLGRAEGGVLVGGVDVPEPKEDRKNGGSRKAGRRDDV
jgi:hypothetical protein